MTDATGETGELLTVVTVVKNNLGPLRGTLASLDLQSRREFRWLVLDGVSTDGTLEWLRDLPAGKARVVSGKDKSIYDAMNKAVALVETPYCMFLNAGDTLCDAEVMGGILDRIGGERPGVAYGNCIIEANPGFPRRERGQAIRWSWELFYGKVPCHQATIIATESFRRIGLYDDRLRIYADREWLIRLVKDPARPRLQYLGIPIVNYDPSGFSYHRFFDFAGEYFRMIGKHGNPIEIAAGALGWAKAAAYILLSRRAARRAEGSAA